MSYKVVTTATTFYSSTSGVSTYSDTSGISTYSDTSGISTYSDTSGISTYSDNSGISTYSDTSGISTYSDTSGISDYSYTSETSTNVIGGIASVTDFITSGIVTSTGGFISVANTSPVTINVENGILIFSVVGIGSTTFILG